MRNSGKKRWAPSWDGAIAACVAGRGCLKWHPPFPPYSVAFCFGRVWMASVRVELSGAKETVT